MVHLRGVAGVILSLCLMTIPSQAASTSRVDAFLSSMAHSQSVTLIPFFQKDKKSVLLVEEDLEQLSFLDIEGNPFYVALDGDVVMDEKRLPVTIRVPAEIDFADQILGVTGFHELENLLSEEAGLEVSWTMQRYVTRGRIQTAVLLGHNRHGIETLPPSLGFYDPEKTLYSQDIDGVFLSSSLVEEHLRERPIGEMKHGVLLPPGLAGRAATGRVAALFSGEMTFARMVNLVTATILATTGVRAVQMTWEEVQRASSANTMASSASSPSADDTTQEIPRPEEELDGGHVDSGSEVVANAPVGAHPIDKEIEKEIERGLDGQVVEDDSKEAQEAAREAEEELLNEGWGVKHVKIFKVRPGSVLSMEGVSSFGIASSGTGSLIVLTANGMADVPDPSLPDSEYYDEVLKILRGGQPVDHDALHEGRLEHIRRKHGPESEGDADEGDGATGENNQADAMEDLSFTFGRLVEAVNHESLSQISRAGGTLVALGVTTPLAISSLQSAVASSEWATVDEILEPMQVVILDLEERLLVLHEDEVPDTELDADEPGVADAPPEDGVTDGARDAFGKMVDELDELEAKLRRLENPRQGDEEPDLNEIWAIKKEIGFLKRDLRAFMKRSPRIAEGYEHQLGLHQIEVPSKVGTVTIEDLLAGR